MHCCAYRIGYVVLCVVQLVSTYQLSTWIYLPENWYKPIETYEPVVNIKTSPHGTVVYCDPLTYVTGFSIRAERRKGKHIIETARFWIQCEPHGVTKPSNFNDTLEPTGHDRDDRVTTFQCPPNYFQTGFLAGYGENGESYERQICKNPDDGNTTYSLEGLDEKSKKRGDCGYYGCGMYLDMKLGLPTPNGSWLVPCCYIP